MLAGVLHDFGDLRIEEVPDPEPGPDEVVIGVACVQLSVTECALIDGHDVYGREGVGRLLETDGPQQLFGHEFCGYVEAVGDAVTSVGVGDFVTSIELVPCGTCRACTRGFRFECPDFEVLGFHRAGALAEAVVVPESIVTPLPDTLSIYAGAALQPLSSAVLCHTVAGIRPGETLAFIGGGVMGLLGLQVARCGNAGRILLTTRDPRKLELAREFGADVTVGADEDPVSAVRDLTDGLGADVVFETAGGPDVLGLAGTATLEQATEMVRRGGRIVQVGVLPSRAEAPLGTMRTKYISFLNPPSGVRHHSPSAHTLEHAVHLVDTGLVDVERLVTHRLTGLASTHEAIDITVNKREHGAINPAQIVLREET